jgi:hypothetical protein
LASGINPAFAARRNGGALTTHFSASSPPRPRAPDALCAEGRAGVDRVNELVDDDNIKQRCRQRGPRRKGAARGDGIAIRSAARSTGPREPTMTTHEQMDSVIVLEKRATSGWNWNMTLVRLPGGGVLVHSPTWLGDETWARVAAIGEPRVLFAPNHFHHVGLQRFRARFPRAIAVATAGATPRLRGKGHDGLQGLSETIQLLPSGARWLECEGTKNGEAWLSLPGAAGRIWIVCDAFFHMTRAVTGAMGLGLRALGVGMGLRVSRSFRWVGVASRPTYCRWALAAIDREQPRTIFGSHGEPLTAADLPERLADAIRRAL